MRSCQQSDVKRINGVACFPFVVFVIFAFIYPQLFGGVLLLSFVAILPILDQFQLVQYLVRFRELQWVLISLP